MKTTIHFGANTVRLCIPFGEPIPRVEQDTLETSEVTCKKCIKALEEEKEAELIGERMS